MERMKEMKHLTTLTLYFHEVRSLNTGPYSTIERLISIK